MSLSKQLYIIIAFIFFIIFSGDFFINVKKTKEYLEVESLTKAQDTATSLGMSLRSLINNKKDPEILSIIRAISNSGFYKELRLEDASFTITDKELIQASTDLNNENWQITDISVEPKYGLVEKIRSDKNINEELLKLENETENLEFETEESVTQYRYIPSSAYKNGGNITFNFSANYKDKNIDTFANLDIKKVLISESRNIKFEYVPQWFIDLIPMHLEEKYSEISDGWKTSAIIYVSPNPGEAYAKLYEQAKNSIIYAIISFIVSMLILFVFVQYLLKPLKTIESLAKNIAKANFGVIENLPWTTEIKNVAIAMNDMSRKIEAIISKLNLNLKDLSKKLSEDELTKLYLKPSFETDIKHMFIKKENGYVFTLKIDNLAKFAKTHTDSEVDEFILDFAKVLKELNNNTEAEVQAYRFFGSEFVLIAKACNLEQAKDICSKLKRDFNTLAQKYSVKELAHIGVTKFNEFGNTTEILQASNEAYEKAKLIGPNEFFIAEGVTQSRDMNEWRDLVFEIIDNSSFQVNFINNVYSIDDSANLVMQEAFTNVNDKQKNTIPIGSFVSIAEKYEKIIDFDKSVIDKVINFMIINNIKHDICINLSVDSISNNEFIIWLQKKVSKNKAIAPHLVFSITAYSVAKDMNVFKNFCNYIHNCDAKVIVKRFETKFIPSENLKELNLDYIRLARDYTINVKNDKNKIKFIESINELAHLLNIKIIAEDVKNDDDFEVIKECRLFAASR